MIEPFALTLSGGVIVEKPIPLAEVLHFTSHPRRNFYLHASIRIDGDGLWTVTDGPTGLAVQSGHPSKRAAVNAARIALRENPDVDRIAARAIAQYRKNIAE